MEICVSLVIAAVVATAVHRGVQLLDDLAFRAEEHRNASRGAAAVRREIIHWLRGAAVATGGRQRGFVGTGRVSPQGTPNDVLVFETLAPGPFLSGAARIELRTDGREGVAAKKLIALVAPQAPRVEATDEVSGTSSSGRERVAAKTLVPAVEGLEIRYLRGRGKDAEWVDTWDSEMSLPHAVRLHIVGPSVPPLLQLPILVSMDHSE